MEKESPGWISCFPSIMDCSLGAPILVLSHKDCRMEGWNLQGLTTGNPTVMKKGREPGNSPHSVLANWVPTQAGVPARGFAHPQSQNGGTEWPGNSARCSLPDFRPWAKRFAGLDACAYTHPRRRAELKPSLLLSVVNQEYLGSWTSDQIWGYLIEGGRGNGMKAVKRYNFHL